MAVDMRLFKVDAKAFLANTRSVRIAAFSCMRFITHTSLKVDEKPILEMGH